MKARPVRAARRGRRRRAQRGVDLNAPDGFVSVRKDRFELIARREWADQLVKAGVLAERAPQHWSGARPVAPGGRGGTVLLALSGSPGLKVVVKPLLRGGLLGRFNRAGHLSAGLLVQEARLCAALRRREVAASDMVFGRAETLFGPFCRLHLGTAEISGAVPLLACLQNETPGAPPLLATLRAAGACVRGLHDAGVLHADLNLSNLLVSPPEGLDVRRRVHVIDLTGSLLARSISPNQRAANLARLLRHAVKNGLHTRIDLSAAAAAFMEGYAPAGDGKALRDRARQMFRRTLTLHRVSWLAQGLSVPRPACGG